MEWKEVTIEGLKEHRADLVATLTGTDETSQLAKQLAESQESLKTVTEELDALKAKEAKQSKMLRIAEVLKAAGIDTSNKVVCSEAFMAALDVAADEAGRKALIEDRLAVAQLGPKTRTAPPATPPLAALGESTEVQPAKDVKEFISRL